MNSHGSLLLLLLLKFTTVELSQLAAMTRCVTMATAETTAREMIRELILLYQSFLNDSPLQQQDIRQIDEEKQHQSKISFTDDPL